MTGAEIAQIITSLATLAGVIGGLWLSARNSKKIDDVHTSTNGKMDQLISEVRTAAEAKGLKQGREEHRPRPS